MTKEIPLTQGKVAIVDDEDFDRISQFKWYAKKAKKRWYAYRSIRICPHVQKGIFMHDFILTPPRGMQADHLDNDGLNNQRSNLRTCTGSQNQHNRSAYLNNKSGFKGVNYRPRRHPWQAGIRVNGKKQHLGSFITAQEAAHAYDAAAIKYHGEFAHLNFPEEHR